MYDENMSEELIMAYREVFSTPKGKRVLAHMLTELGFFDEVDLDNKMAISLQNYAKHLLYRCGLIRGDIIYDFISLLFRIPYQYKEELKNE